MSTQRDNRNSSVQRMVGGCGRITVTGADENTPLDALADLARDAEIGLLYTAAPEGRNRYPSREWLHRAALLLEGQFALHVCGRAARAELLEGGLRRLTHGAARVQVNGRVEPRELASIGARLRGQTVITQHTDANDGLRIESLDNHALLVDQSGGRGVSPDAWLKPRTEKTVGFAGGLGPDNLLSELPRIAAVTEPGWWVDMEGKLRTNDWFDVEKARCAVRLFHEWLATANTGLVH